jgi:hypothetical protein
MELGEIWRYTPHHTSSPPGHVSAKIDMAFKTGSSRPPSLLKLGRSQMYSVGARSTKKKTQPPPTSVSSLLAPGTLLLFCLQCLGSSLEIEQDTMLYLAQRNPLDHAAGLYCGSSCFGSPCETSCRPDARKRSTMPLFALYANVDAVLSAKAQAGR